MEKINQIEADLDNFVTNEKLETTEVKVDFIKEKVDSIDQGSCNVEQMNVDLSSVENKIVNEEKFKETDGAIDLSAADFIVSIGRGIAKEENIPMAKELAEIMRRDANIDWQYKENVRAKLRLKIKTLLKRYKYPPDEQITAVETVLQQAETLGEELVAR